MEMDLKDLTIDRALRYYTDIINALPEKDYVEFIEATDTIVLLKLHQPEIDEAFKIFHPRKEGTKEA